MAVPGIGRRLAMAVAAVVTVLAGVLQTAATAPVRAAGTEASIEVDRLHPAGRLPSDFVGLSFEMRELGVGNLGASTGNLPALFRTLGRSNIRISGNTLDRDTLWVPAGQQPPQPLPAWVQDVVTPADIARLDGLLDATGWRAEVGINMGRFDAALAADEARTLFGTLGDGLVAAECGNEPNSWVSKGFRTAPYGYPQYRPEWEACAAAVASSRIAGPDTSSPGSTGPWVTQFAQDERSRLRMLTQHAYSVGESAGVTGLLSPATDASEVASVAAQLAAARAQHLPLRLDETNSSAGGGILGVSDVYASALWAMDYSLLMAQDGLSGLNFHGGLGVCDAPLFNGKFQRYTPICAADAAGAEAKVYVAAPEYYGLYMASHMGPGRFLPVALSTTANVTAYAVRGDDGRTRLAIVEKDDMAAGPVHVTVRSGREEGAARVVHLTGTSLASAQGVAIQGEKVDASGHLPRRPADRVRAEEGVLSLDIASGSAAIVTLGGEDDD
jgi:hypothetical protein